ncbi:hypothetical protein GBA52_002721 [Prunus armeniaca]|nr:hypothetical protein GBA52_002721 [Prunus armeniaca]
MTRQGQYGDVKIEAVIVSCHTRGTKPDPPPSEYDTKAMTRQGQYGDVKIEAVIVSCHTRGTKRDVREP